MPFTDYLAVLCLTLCYPAQQYRLLENLEETGGINDYAG